VLAARACLAGGTGLLTACVPSIGYEIIQTAVPEAMALTSGKSALEIFPGSFEKFSAVGAGPGMGTADKTVNCVEDLVTRCVKPLVLDADALNILAGEPSLLKRLPPFSILTPHPKEFERLFGASGNDFERTNLAAAKAAELQVIIVLKGHHSLVAMPGGQLYFNSSGNAGMAKGGSGDVLAGFLTGLLSSGYPPEAAALLGVYLHGLAGDIAATSHSMETMTASDIVAALPLAFRSLDADATAENTGL
jgi:NAD(P)H-hydrate epimerase